LKGIKFLIAVMLLGTVFSFNVKVTTATTKAETLYVVADNLNVREKASTKSKKVGSLKLGSKVKVYSKTNSGWSKIDYKKKKAYVFSEYIKKAPKNQYSRINFFAKQGQIEPALPLAVNDKISSLINVLGKPTDEYNTGYGFYMDYHKKDFTTTFVMQESGKYHPIESYKDLNKNAYIQQMEFYVSKNEKNTFKNLKSALGKPYSIEDNNNHSYLLAYYDLGKFYVGFMFPKKDYKDETISDNDRLIQYRVILK